MAANFRTRIRIALSNQNLQAALDTNAERRLRVRLNAFALLDDPERSRQKAHAIRSEVIDHLDEYLARFIHQAEKNGMIVHRAVDARQAVEVVLAIARQHGAGLIAKSKTMVSEEIGLNHALESAGLRVVETDLGEYIVQLRGEAPSHIITPAVHLRRADVGRLFAEKLNLPYTEDIPQMTAAARRVLRDVFLKAEVGISGVNLAVADTGMLCVLTNEGNGRMVTTLPRVHIALLGMERLVPTLQDLALMLRLLPRSATGQKLTVYTNLLYGPRRPDDPDGPQERHVIIVDNGRSQLRESPLVDMLFCIRCGACLNACPVFREIGGHAYVGKDGRGSPYPGPMGSVLAPGLFGQAEYGQLARASSLCGACREACPVDIDLPRLLLRVRAGMTKPEDKSITKREAISSNAPGWLAMGLHIFTWAAENPRRFRFAQKLAGWVAGGPGWLHLPAWSGWGYSKDFPKPAKKTFQERWMKGEIGHVQDDFLPVMDNKLTKDESILTQSVNKAGEAEELNPKTRLEQFQAELTALGAQVIRCENTDPAEKVLELLQSHGYKEVLTWDAAYLPKGMLAILQEAGIQIMHPTWENLSQAGRVHAGLTGTIAAAVETGSIAMTGGPGRPLVTSLLPEVHIIVIQKEKVLSSLDELLLLPELNQAAAGVLIGGPSRTADIEMTLTIGVHGPGELIVIVY